MSNSFIRNFTSFQKRRNEKTNIEDSLTESVKVINDRFIIGGIELKQSMINSYIKKVKDSTGQDLNNTFSKSEIAEQLINFLVDKHGDVDNIPPSALLGGDEEMVDQVEDISMEEEDVIVDEEGISEFEEESDDEVEAPVEDVEEFEEESDDEIEFDDEENEFQDIDEEEVELEETMDEEESDEETDEETEEETDEESDEESDEEEEEEDLPL